MEIEPAEMRAPLFPSERLLMKPLKSFWVPVVVSIVLSACSSASRQSEGRDAHNAGRSPSAAGRDAPRGPGPGLTDAEASGIAAGQSRGSRPQKNVVYFAFDSAEVQASDRQVLLRWAAYLQSRPATRIQLRGHADERGTPEYNIGLGERRAIAVRALLVSEGVKEDQLSVISFGEEQPAVDGRGEAVWSKNRRVELAE